MKDGKCYRTPDRPGRARRTHLEVASPFSLFAKELPPITPPRPSWANPSVAWTGQPGLSPALAGFATPGLNIEHVEASGQTPRRSLKLPREMGTKPSQRSLSAAAVLVHLPELERNTNSESRAAHGQLERLLSKDEASSREVVFSGRGDQHEANVPERPSESRAASLTTPENDCSDPSTFSWEAACDQGKRALALTSEVESTVAVPPVKHQVSMVDLWQPISDNTAQQTTVGWERKLESAGNIQTWHRSDSETAKSPLSQTAHEGQQEVPAAGKGQTIGASRPDVQHLHPGSVAALHAAGTPARRLSTSSGSKASVVPPHTPGDDVPMPLTIGPGVTAPEPPKKCNCKKSRCLKLYCDCFAAGQYCKHSCSCQSCMNTADNRDLVVNMREQVRQRNPQAFQQKIEKQALGQGVQTGGLHRRGCHCKKSHCKKKYCECFQAGVNCGVHCKCEDCHNTPEDGLPPPPKIPKAGNLSAPQMLLPGQAALTAHTSKTSPGTPPAMNMDITTDSRRALQRTVKRRATWLPETQAGSLGQQTQKRVHTGPVPVLTPSVLSPPDMVWPAHNLAQAPAHVLKSTGNDQPSRDSSKQTLCQQRINWPDHTPLPMSISPPRSAPPAAVNQPDQLQAASMAPAQGTHLEVMPTLLYIPALSEERPTHAYTSHMLLQLLAQTAGHGGLSQPRLTEEGQATLDAATQLVAHATHARDTAPRSKPSISCMLQTAGKPVDAEASKHSSSASLSKHTQDFGHLSSRQDHQPQSNVGGHREDLSEGGDDRAKVHHPGAQIDVEDFQISSHTEKSQGAPVEVWQACTGFAPDGQLVAGNASAAQDAINHALDLQSPGRVATSSQMRMKRVAAGRTVISPSTGRFSS